MLTIKNHIKIDVRGIEKSFTLHNRGGANVSGFSEVSFSVKRGELLALTGPSGAGKSSVLKAIYRTYPLNSGQILFHRRDNVTVNLAKCSESEVLRLRKREISFVTQFLKILPRITALQAVALPLIESGVDELQALDRAAELLDFLGIREELFHISPLTFSGGEQQRVNIARGVIAPKSLILLDEPTASLDGESAEKILTLLTDLKEKGIAMVAIFHDKKKIKSVADKTYEIMRKESMLLSPVMGEVGR